jgi:hypothetical protein
VTRGERYTFAVVDTFPTMLEPGVLYVSTRFSTAGHICPCGCGREVVTKLSPARYRVVFDGEVSLAPSVALSGPPCKSHYFITRGEVDWQRQLTPGQAERASATDRRAVEDSRNAHRPGWATRVWRLVRQMTW